jgi:hypothetical protein
MFSSSNDQNFLKSKIVICIPMALKTREVILSSLVKKYGVDYLLLGKTFQDKTTNEYCEIDIYALQKSNFVRLFKLLAQEQVSDTTLEQINNCSQVIYLTSHNLGYDACLKMAKYTQVFLSIGGITVIVDSAGIVHDKDKWLASYNSQDIFDIYSLFVTLVVGDNYYYSCGMQNFAKADVSVDLTEDISLATYVMNVFNYYRLTESAMLKDGQTFQPDLECPMYRMQWSKHHDEYEIDNPRYNSYGIWHLSRVREDLDIDYQFN